MYAQGWLGNLGEPVASLYKPPVKQGLPAYQKALALICGSPSLNAPSEGIQTIGKPQGTESRATSEATGMGDRQS